MTVQMGLDKVQSYFGMREISLCKDPSNTVRPCLNNQFRFLAGFLDQVTAFTISFWKSSHLARLGTTQNSLHQ